MTQTLSALIPGRFALLPSLTDRYARDGGRSTGLGSVRGGLFALLLPAALPFLWLGAKEGLRARWCQSYGRGEPNHPEARMQRRLRVPGSVLGFREHLAFCQLDRKRGYIQVAKSLRGKSPVTSFHLIPQGRAALATDWAQWQAVRGLGEAA